MTTIKLVDARRGLNRKCDELFGNAKIAEAIYRFLCDGIEECEDAEPQRIHGEWIRENIVLTSDPPQYRWHCGVCGKLVYWFNDSVLTNFCSNCGADMRKETEDASGT